MLKSWRYLIRSMVGSCSFDLNRQMVKDFERCPHCRTLQRDGRVIRHLSTTPLISRSDGESFRLYLFAGPIEWLGRTGEIVADRAIANFVCRSEPLELDHSCVVLFDIPIGGKIENELRGAADQMSEILAVRRVLRSNLHYSGGRLGDLDLSIIS
jgi:hypothetical protein